MNRPDPGTIVTDSTIQDDILRSREGDQRAFRRVVLSYQAFAFRLAFRLLADEDEAKDVVQECFIRIWYGISRFDPTKKFTTWMYRIVSNLCIDRLRSRRRYSGWFRRTAEHEERQEPSMSISPDEQYSNAQLALLIRTLSDRLPPKEKLVFALRDLEDMAVDEVAAITGMSSDDIKANLFHARRAIRRTLEREYMPEGKSQ